MKSRSFLIVILIVAVAGVIAWKRFGSAKPAVSHAPKAVAVRIETAASREVGLWLTGIGNVQANNTVTVRPRVSGELQSVSFVEGAEVKAGDVLAQIDPRPYRATLAQAIARRAQEVAQNDNNRREYDRVQGLVASNTESRQLLDQREAALAQSAALVQASQAAIDTATLDLDFTTVRAPIDGHTGVRLLDAGNLVTASQNSGLVVITQTKPISVIFTLPQQNFAALRQGITAAAGKPLPVEALDDSGKVLARGELELIDNQIDTSTGTLRLKARFANEDQSLWPGQFVNARVLTHTLDQALTVPTEAVQPGLDGPFIYVVKPDSTVEARPVKLGPTVEAVTVINSGLAVGERVVREGQNKLRPNARVEIAQTTADLATR